MTERLEIPTISPAQAEWGSALIGRRRDLSFAIGKSPFRAVFVPPQPIGPALGLRILVGDHRFRVHFPDWQPLLGHVETLAGVDPAQMPPEIAAVCFDAAFGELFGRLTQLSGVALRIEGVDLPAGVSTGSVGLELHGADGLQVIGDIQADDGAMAMLASLVSKLPAVTTVPTPGLAHVAGVEIGMTSLPLDDALSLRVHDVVLMDVTAFLPNRIGVIRTSEDTAWRVSVDGEAVVLQESRPAAPVPEISRDSPVVILLFEAGQVRIPLDKYGELAPGAKIERHNATQILIRMDRTPFAAGELVQVGDRLGVRLQTIGDVPLSGP